MKKKILFVNGHMNSGGVEKSLLDVLIHIDYQKYDVDILLFEDLGDYIDYIPPNVNIIYRDNKNSYGSFLHSVKKCLKQKDFFNLYLRVLILLKKILGSKVLILLMPFLKVRKEYDCAIAYRIGFCSKIVAYAIKAKKKIVWWHHGEINFTSKEISLYHQVLSKFDELVSVSKPFTEKLSKIFSDLPISFRTIPNMIDINAVVLKSLEESSISDEQFKIVSVGRLSPEKHFENIVEAAKKLTKKGYKQFHWYIIGDGIEMERIKHKIVSCQLENIVVLLGKKRNPYPDMKMADLFVHPSYVESQGLTVLEAMALGVPCVVTESLGTKTFVVDGVNAVMVEQNVDSLVNGIIKLLNDQDLRDIVVKNEYETVKQYSPEIIMNQIYELLEERR